MSTTSSSSSNTNNNVKQRKSSSLLTTASVSSAVSTALATHFLFYNSDTIILDWITTPMIVHLIRTPEFKWFAFNRVDDRETTLNCHRIVATVGAMLSENALLTTGSLISLLALPTHLKKKFFIDTFLLPVADHLNKWTYKFLTAKSFQEKPVLRASVVGCVAGCSLYHALVVFPFGCYKHICLPMFQNLLNKIVPGLPESSALDHFGASLLFGAYSYLGYSVFRKMLSTMTNNEKMNEEESNNNNDKNKFSSVKEISSLVLDE